MQLQKGVKGNLRLLPSAVTASKCSFYKSKKNFQIFEEF